MIVKMAMCENCGKKVENGYATPGWIKLDGSVSRSSGVYETTWEMAFIEKDEHDFCSIWCLISKFDDLDEKRAAAKSRKKGKEVSDAQGAGSSTKVLS